MSSWLRRILVVLGTLALLLVAYAPLSDAGWRGGDRAVLAAVEADASGAAVYPGSLLAGPWTALSALAWGSGGTARDAMPYRIENLLLLGLCALAAAVFLKRLLLPWTGSSQARASARALLAILWVHPLAISAVAGLEARADLLALMLCACSAAAFLRARHEHRFGFQGLAGACAIGAGAAGELGLALPFLLGGAEFLSAHRYRPRKERLRTTLITAVSYGACVVSVPLCAQFLGGASAVVPSGAGALAELASPQGVLRVLVLFVEKLGVLVLPANTHGLGLVGTGLAGLAILVAMQPGLVAARSAPRLWGWLLLGWLLVLFATSLPGAEVRVQPEDFGKARLLLGPALVVSVGLAVASTAVSGPRRAIAPIIVALCYGAIAQGNAWCVRAAAGACAALEAEIASARASFGNEAQLCVIDPPLRVRGEEAAGTALALFDPSAAPGAAARGLSRAAFLALAREPELAELRAQRELVVLLAQDALEPLALRSEAAPHIAHVLLPAPEPSTRMLSWRGESRSPDMDLEMTSIGSLRVRAPYGVDRSHVQAVSWSARHPLATRAAHEGSWLPGSAEPIALFDLSDSLAWRVGERARRLWFETGLLTVMGAELSAELPSPFEDEVELTRGEEDWSFPSSASAVARQLGARGAWDLELFDLASWEHVRLEVELDEDAERLRVVGVEPAIARVLTHGGGPVVWSLALRIEGRAVARLRGRVQP